MVANLRVCALLRVPLPGRPSRERVDPAGLTRAAWSGDRPRPAVGRPAEFRGLPSPIRSALPLSTEATGLSDAMLVGEAAIGGLPVALAVMDFRLPRRQHGIGGGREVRARPRPAIERRMPLVLGCLFRRSPDAGGRAGADADGEDRAAVDEPPGGGEARTSALAHPTTGGVAASSPRSATPSSQSRAPRVVLAGGGSPSGPSARTCPTTSAWPSRTTSTATTT